MRFPGLIAAVCLALACALVPSHAENPAAPLQKLPAAQKAVLYEEDTNNPNGIPLVGGVVWRTERVLHGVGQAPETVVRGDINIPDKKISISLSLRHNDDKQLPASHTVQIEFRLPPGFSHRNIVNLPAIMASDGEAMRGAVLNGASVKVTDNSFLVGLSATDGDVQRNVQLLKDKSWFGILAAYADGKRVYLAIEKGPPGERAFSEAFAAWEQEDSDRK